MIKFIVGAKGSGKTKWLIDNANEDLKSGNGNIAFVDVDDDHIFSLDYQIRLINAQDYKLTNIDSLCGFICGLMAMDFDLEKIYIDSVYKIIDLNKDNLETLYDKLSSIEEIKERQIFINVDCLTKDLPEKLQACSEEVTLED
ncbi:Uncharacterised protein [Urinicoccus massiliensis]|uniref:Twitching motility protein PilT n=1 Tax=Urinicoccus massiliensis TaxID=1723382 RepID=A0A8H2M4H4_9FIRM|nr:hypothetical protein [Urinicoccus massiliensis]VFB16294.1 Uncharacterised protein [Urinicoccus massiliensis]